MKIIKGINDKNKNDIVKWTNEKGKDFLEQWAGASLDFPLTVSQIDNMSNIYSIFCENEFIGIIQKIREETENVHIGRFLVNPELTGKGLGKRALIEFINLIFQDENVNSITLNVFDYNVGAKKLYEKVGFKVVNVTENPMKKYMMIMKKGEK
ncbi:GNAT family N-acetyltransferase [Leptotrichia sp. oral taxon 223]|uniref:GNAT family N-acetyltransferase n=1 Tax=Leptotrichia sp. oral taxon 223 TaxID=712363 RepID=UPI0015BE63B7|nr:GNAT family N-acetyltransferase [Leptotrichia sp. oral taxon 223]NWO19601.1 GNAT family N-acetyltransferase [Leptotrichia sp. oral taxon 223]